MSARWGDSASDLAALDRWITRDDRADAPGVCDVCAQETDDSVTVRGVAVARCGGCVPEGCDRPSIAPGTVLRVLSLVGAWS